MFTEKTGGLSNVSGPGRLGGMTSLKDVVSVDLGTCVLYTKASS